VNLNEISNLSKFNKKNSSFVAVTVDPTDKFIKENLLGNFEYIQLHGSETAERVSEIKSMGIKIIKAIKVKEEKDINKYKEFNDVDIILFDTPGMEKSLEFPKDLITKLPLGEKYALAGSISKDNVENISKLGINFFDLSSSLENQLGYKDHLKIRNFMNKFNELKN
jgi:phosphoribosylanthranilate isomerase